MRRIDANVNRPSDKKKLIIMIAKHTRNKIKWFPFNSIVEHTAGIIETDISLIPLLFFKNEMFQMRLF